ncbi:MAG: hypothetical protein ACO1NW_02370 [Chitinophagaceae bacterium]
MQRLVIVFLILFNTLVFKSFSQKVPEFSLMRSTEILWKKNHAKPVMLFSTKFLMADSAAVQKAQVKPLMADFHTRHWGFFCAQEWKMEKAIRFPVKMRLGSVEYVDRMEGKRR